jgi:IMP dehydrogenase
VHVDDILGVVPAARLGTALPDAQLGDLARAHALDRRRRRRGARHAFDLIVAAEAETVCVLHHGYLVGTLAAHGAALDALPPAVDATGG